MNRYRAEFAILILAALLCAGPAAAVVPIVTNWWTGGAATTNWSHAANWAKGVPTTNHYVRFGYKGVLSDVPNVPQNIHVDGTTQFIAQVQFDCDGSRAVTLSGTNLVVRAPEPVGLPYAAVNISPTATADATVNVVMRFDTYQSVYTYQNSPTAKLIVGPKGHMYYSSAYWGQAGTQFMNPNGAGQYRIEGRWSIATSRCAATNWVVAPGPGVSYSIAGISTRNGVATPITLWLDGDMTVAGNFTMSDTYGGILMKRRGAGDRVAKVTRNVAAGPLRAVTLRHGDAQNARLTFQVVGLGVLSSYVDTTTNTTVEFIPYTTSTADRHLLWADNPGIVGAGSMSIAMSATNTQFLVRRSLAHTGGTVVKMGVLELSPWTTNSIAYSGQLPNTGPVTVEASGTWKLAAINDTIGGLGGNGTVNLAGATLTVTEGLAPGMGVGTLRVVGAGALVLSGSTNRFEFSAATNTFDKVTLPNGANLTLGGALQVTAPDGFSDYGAGRYKIIDLTGGSINGALSPIIPPDRMTAQVDTSSGDVVLILKRRPTGSAITVR